MGSQTLVFKSQSLARRPDRPLQRQCCARPSKTVRCLISRLVRPSMSCSPPASRSEAAMTYLSVSGRQVSPRCWQSARVRRENSCEKSGGPVVAKFAAAFGPHISELTESPQCETYLLARILNLIGEPRYLSAGRTEDNGRLRACLPGMPRHCGAWLGELEYEPGKS